MLRRQVTGFLLAGAGGFVVDAGILQSLVSLLGVHPYPARAVSFTAAVLFTWWVNRSWSFAVDRRPSWAEFFLYLRSMIVGGVINWIVYSLLIARSDTMRTYPALALVPAVALAMIFNFSAMRFWIFRPR
jgi:putative flippase GtrA